MKEARISNSNNIIKSLKNHYIPSDGISRKRYFLYYTIIFVIAVLVVFGIFFINGKSFIWNVDGLEQHYRALVYYARWLRSIAKNILIEHTWEIPAFSFSIGYGSDIMTTLEYYTIGDPLSVFSVFVPTRFIGIYYSFMYIFRLYLSGIAFSLFCFYKNDQMNIQGQGENFPKTAVLTGSLVYVFTGYAMFSCLAHPFFANSMIYFPLILIGVEKILDKKKPWTFILMVFISAVSNFYFFYMIAIMTALYVIYRLIIRYHWAELRHALLMLAKIAGYAILGTCISAVILLPVILLFLGDSRSSTGFVYDFLYSLSDYESLFGDFISLNDSIDYRTYGYATIGLITIFLLFISKKHRNLKIIFSILTVMTLLPVVGSITNGFSYPANRWIWAYSLLIAYILVIEWKELFELNAQQKKWLVLCVIVYALICTILIKSRTISVFFSLAVMLISVLIVTIVKDRFGLRYAQMAVLVCVLINISGNGMFVYSHRYENYFDASHFVSLEETMGDLSGSDSSVVRQASDNSDEFFRYSGSSASRNGTLLSGLHSTNYYWSLSNGNISEFQLESDLSDSLLFHSYRTPDSRTILSELSNVKYYVQEDKIPYGYSYAEDDNNLTLWENENYLPFGYTYDSYISREDYEVLTPLEKQEALLEGCVIESSEEGKDSANLSFSGEQLPFETEEGDGIIYQEGCIDVKKENATLTLSFDGVDNAETYLYVTNLAYEGYSPRELYSEEDWDNLSSYDKNEIRYASKYYVEATSLSVGLTSTNTQGENIESTLTYYTPKYRFYSGRKNFMVNLGYDEYGQCSITMQFPTTGKYTFDSLEVLCQPMDYYIDQVTELGNETMENVDFHENEAFATNQVTGEIHLSEDKYLLLTIPYSSGWTAIVDGEDQELLRANTMYMALKLNAGDHNITLNYQTPGKTVGWIISIISVGILVVMMVISKISVKVTKNKQRESE